MAKSLFILNEPPYGNERSYNALRLAAALARAPDELVRMFLIGDAAGCARAGQKVPAGFYNIELMLRRLKEAQAEIGVCGTCMDARGMEAAQLVPGTRRSSLEELTNWTSWADKVLVF